MATSGTAADLPNGGVPSQSDGGQGAAVASAPAPSSPSPSNPAGASGGGVTSPSSGGAPVQTSTGSTTAPAAAGTTTGQTAPATASDYVSIRDALSPYLPGFAQRFQDDNAALLELMQGYRQAQQFQQAGLQNMLPHMSEFQQFLQQRQQAQQQPAKPSWWKAPEYDPRWEQMLEKDPATGAVRVKDGYPPDVLSKYTQYREHQRTFLEKFSQDPIGAIKPGIEELAREIAMQAVSESLGGYQNQQFANNYVRENSSWIHARDQQGNPLRDPANGQPVLSDMGRRFGQYVIQLEQRGVTDVRLLQELATSYVQRDYALLQMQQFQQAANPQQAQQQANQQFLQQNNGAAARTPNAGGSLQNPAQAPSGSQPSQNQSLRLADRMRNAFAASGVR